MVASLGLACGASDDTKSEHPWVETVSEVETVVALEADDELESIAGVRADPSLLFDSSRVVELRLELAEEDWAELRMQTRSMFDLLGGDCTASPAESPYTWFEANLELDGQRLEQVTVRKKGFIGSLSTSKPGLKVDFDNLVDGRRLHGMERITLNNTPQDPTMLRTCLAYDHFRRVGVPAPRCGFAHVVVNGEDLGIYALLQAVDDHFLADNDIDPDVPIFEGTLSDFREGWTGTFDADSDDADPDLIDGVRLAIESGDFDAIASVVDIDAFIRFWVAEATMAHWDGYGWNTNNYYVYFDPTDGRARFLPWGADATWASASPGGGLDWIPLTSALPRALVAIPEIEALYRAEVERQLDLDGDVGEILDRINSFEDTISPWHRAPDAVSDLRWLADHQLSTMRNVSWSTWPNPTGPLRDPFCMDVRGEISFTFEGAWGSWGGGAAPGTCTGSYTWDGTTVAMSPGVLYAGPYGDIGGIHCVHPAGANGAQLMSYNALPPDELAPGTIDFEYTVRRSVWYYTDDSMGGNWTDISWVEGTMQLDEASPGGTVRGSFTGTLWSPAW